MLSSQLPRRQALEQADESAEDEGQDRRDADQAQGPGQMACSTIVTDRRAGKLVVIEMPKLTGDDVVASS